MCQQEALMMADGGGMDSIGRRRVRVEGSGLVLVRVWAAVRVRVY